MLALSAGIAAVDASPPVVPGKFHSPSMQIVRFNAA